MSIAGARHLTKRLFELPDSNFQDRNHHLPDLCSAAIDGIGARAARIATIPIRYRVDRDPKAPPKYHGPYPGSANRAILAALLHAFDEEPLLNLCQNGTLQLARSQCQVSPGPPLWFENGVLAAAQSPTDWENDNRRRHHVGRAFGQLAYDSQGPDFPKKYEQIAAGIIDLRTDFATIFGLAIFDRKVALGTYFRGLGSSAKITFSYRLDSVKAVIEKLRS